MPVFLGIDWSHTHHDACWLDERGHVLSRLTVPHSVEGLTQLDSARAQLGVMRADPAAAAALTRQAFGQVCAGASLSPV